MVIKKRSRRKMTIEELFETDHYRSIIVLTACFDRGEGLRQLYYRWALIKDHDNIKLTYFIKKMNEFFTDKEGLHTKFWGTTTNKLEQLYRQNLIKKDCISSNSNLSNFLKKLVEDYQILKKNEIEGITRYKLTKKAWNIPNRWQCIQLIKSFNDEVMKDILNWIWEFVNQKIKENINYQKRLNFYQ